MKPADLPPLPADLAAERALLGSLILRPGEIGEVLDTVRPDDFWKPAHAMIYDALMACRERLTGSTGDVVILAAELRLRGQSEATGGLGYVSDLQAAATLGLDRHYAALVRDASLLRHAIVASRAAAMAAYAGTEAPAEIAHRLSVAASEISLRAGEAGPSQQQLALAVVSDAAEAAQGRRPSLLPHVSDAIDDFVPPLGPGEMGFVGARPKCGKSHLAGDLGYGYARHGAPGLILTLEDPPLTWTRREMAKLAGLDAEEVRRGALDLRGWTALHAAGAEVAKLPVAIEWAGGKRACDLAGRIAWHARRRAIKWAVIDYFQLVRPSVFRRGQSREEDTSQAIDEVKAAAGAAGVGLLICSQLRRLGPGEHEPRPNASDLRNSGMLEAQADWVILIWRHDRTDARRAKLLLTNYKHGQPGERALLWSAQRRDYRLDDAPAYRAPYSED